MARRTLAGAAIVVTGASSGIGRELALQLAARGARLLLVARREDRLRALVEQLSGQQAQAGYIAGDITEPQLRDQVVKAAQDQLGGIDVLINNAGVGALGRFSAANESRLRRIFEVNFFAPVELIRICLPLLRQGRRPMIVNIGSVLGHRAVANKSEYCASKFATHGFTDALRCELAREGIDVLLVSPSTTASEFFDNVIDKRGSARSLRAMPAAKVARRTIRAIESGRHEIILSAGGKLLVWLDRLCPPLADRILARFQ